MNMKRNQSPIKYAALLAILLLSSCTGGGKSNLSKDGAVALAREAFR